MKHLLLLLLALVIGACESTALTTDQANQRAACEDGANLSTVYSENAANADFGTNISLPANGENFLTSCNLAETTIGELADRTQWLKAWAADTPSTKTLVLPLTPAKNSGFSNSGVSAGVWLQTSTSSPFISFDVPPLPLGRKILRLVARWQNEGTSSLPSSGQMPKVKLLKYNRATGVNFYAAGATTVATATDTAASLGAYQVNHEIAATCSETTSVDSLYTVEFDGETLVVSGTLIMIYLQLGL